MSRVWSLKTKYQDKKKGKKYPGITKVVIQEDKAQPENSKLRLDIYGPLGFVHVGTLIINNGQIFVKAMNGERFQGEATPEGIEKLLKIPLEPMDMFALFTQAGFVDRVWVCSMGQNNTLSECEHRPYDVSVQWSGSMSQVGTKLDLNHPRAKVQFKVKSYSEKADLDQTVFDF